jgi:hypothetical protein
LNCTALGVDLEPSIRDAANKEDWEKFVLIVLGRFQVFIHLHRGGQCEQDECDLFTALNEEGE